MFSPGCGDELDHLSGAVANGAVLTTTARTSRDEAAPAAAHSWRVALLAETEPGRRNRRTIDSAFLLLAAIVIGLSAVIASSAPGQDRDVAQALTTVFGWAGALWRTAFFGVLGLAVVLVVDMVLRRRWDLVRRGTGRCRRGNRSGPDRRVRLVPAQGASAGALGLS